MGRKNEIEGQLNFLDMLMAESAVEREQEPKVKSDKKDKKDKKKKGAVKVPKPGAFPECSSCWCSTCEHSTVGGSVPRPFGENSRSCPSCELCISGGKADVCVIGSADEGCRYRAEKEGLL